MNFKLGCDPEVFLADLNGHLKSSIGKIGGTKEYPQQLPIGDGFMVQEDNVALEFNIPPAETVKEYVEHIQKTLSFLSEGVKSLYGYQIVNLSAAYFPKEELNTPQAHIFGCDPDYNAWTGKKNPRPSAEDPNLRSCGGHVHVGYDINKVNPRNLIKAMDLFLGVPSVLMDKGELRKQLYGKAGAYREKSYGVEYRTLSNFWIFNPKLIEWVWNSTEKAITAVESQFPVDEFRDEILQAIDKNDKEVASGLVKKLNLGLVYV